MGILRSPIFPPSACSRRLSGVRRRLHWPGADVAPTGAPVDGQEEPSMDLFDILSGIGVLFLGIALADLIAGFRHKTKHAEPTKSYPILLDGWKPLRK